MAKTAAKKPKLHIVDCRLHIQCCLLEPTELLRINQRLSGAGTIALPYMGTVTKSYSIEQGHLQVTKLATSQQGRIHDRTSRERLTDALMQDLNGCCLDLQRCCSLAGPFSCSPAVLQ